MTPEARRDRAAILRRDGVALPPLIVFWPRSVSVPSLSHLPLLSVSYLHARVTPEVKSPGKDVSSELFTATFTG